MTLKILTGPLLHGCKKPKQAQFHGCSSLFRKSRKQVDFRTSCHSEWWIFLPGIINHPWYITGLLSSSLPPFHGVSCPNPRVLLPSDPTQCPSQSCRNSWAGAQMLVPQLLKFPQQNIRASTASFKQWTGVIAFTESWPTPNLQDSEIATPGFSAIGR